MPPRTPPGSAERRIDPADALRARNAQFDALNRLSALISQAGSLEPALEPALAELLSFTEADMGAIHVLEPLTASLRLVASRGVSRGFVCAERRIPLGECLCGEAARTGALVASDDLTAEPRLVRSACREEKFGSVISIPLTSRERSIGILTIYARRARAFSDADQELFMLIGRHVGVAIENSQLAARARELAILEERGLMAQEIHDGIAQSLAYLNLQARRLQEGLQSGDMPQAMAELDEIRRVIKETYDEARDLLVDFRAKFKEGEGLLHTLDRYLEEFGRRAAIRTRLSAGDLGPLPPGTEMPLFRIIQEALSNVRKHAGAREVTVTLASAGHMLEASVCDDGCGFVLADPPDGDAAHFGLAIMRERAARLGGSVRVESRPGGGTTVFIRVILGPLPE